MIELLLHSAMDEHNTRRPRETGSRSGAMESHDSQPDTLSKKTAPDDNNYVQNHKQCHRPKATNFVSHPHPPYSSTYISLPQER